MRNLRICPQVTSKVAAYVATFAFIFIAAANVQANDVPILQPGLPGEGARLLTAEEAVKITDTSYSPDDVAFMQGMIPHHKQALEMAVLVAQRLSLIHI